MSAYGNAAVAQSVERRIGSAEVTGPIPVSSLWRAWYLPGFFSFGSLSIVGVGFVKIPPQFYEKGSFYV